MFKSLKGKTVIVTGAGAGIGKAMALTFGAEGCNVVCVARRKETLDEVVAEIEKAGGSAMAYAADVTDLAVMKQMAAKTVEVYGSIDILLSNAGVLPQVSLSEMSDADFDYVMDINVKGTFHAVLAVMDQMKKQHHGRIILTSSITGPITGYPGWAHYGASKSAQLGFMRTAAMELAPFGITVNAVSPGNVLTEGLISLGEEYVKQMEASVPVGKLGTGFEIANAAMFLASEEAWYVNGHNLVIDGGQIIPESAGALETMVELSKKDPLY
ncbi:MAG: 3-oxoacyl-ACP reductase FabG [Succinivibrio sp.]